jgi:hypothetical protein
MSVAVTRADLTAGSLQSGNGESFVLDFGGVGYLVTIALVRQHGFLVILPAGCMEEEDGEDTAGADELMNYLGIHGNVEFQTTKTYGKEEVTIADFDESILPFIFAVAQWDKDYKDFRYKVRGKFAPPKKVIMPIVSRWIGVHCLVDSEYLTAEEAKPEARGKQEERGKAVVLPVKKDGKEDNAVLQQLQLMASQFGRFESQLVRMDGRLEHLEEARSTSSRVTGRRSPAGGLRTPPFPFMDDLRRDVPKPPRKSEMGGRGSGRGRAIPPDPPPGHYYVDSEEEEAVEETGGAGDLDQMMKLAMMELLKGKQKKKTKHIPGIPSYEAGSSSDEGGGGGITGSKGSSAHESLRQSMRKHPKAFRERVQQRMAAKLQKDHLSKGDVLLFAEKHIGVGKQKTLGYCLQLMCLIAEAFNEGKQEEGLWLLYASIMMMDQYSLDENWKTAWKLIDLPSPPFDRWQVADLGQLRRDTAYTSLAEAGWIAAVANRFKEEDVIIKRRGKGGQKGAAPEKEE